MRLCRYPIVFLLALWALALGACAGGEGSGSPEGALRLEFPGQAALVLDGSDTFELAPGEGEFAVRGHERGQRRRGGLSATLPRQGSDPVRFRLPGGLTVSVREVGAFGEGELAAAAVAYRRAGGTSYWSATEAGFEEWLLLEGGLAHRDQPVASWEVSGAALRQEGDEVFALDARGEARLRIAAPAAFARGGGEGAREVPAKLTLRGESVLELSVDAGGEPVLVDPSWTLTSAMITPRQEHIAALLPDGTALVAGGSTSGEANKLAKCEVYTPATDAWTPTGAMNQGRAPEGFVTLPGGAIFVAGGYTGASGATAKAEAYDPSAKAWKLKASMSISRRSSALTGLADGKVLVTGGVNSGLGFLSSAEVYDPAKNTWTPRAAMSGPRAGHVTALLPSGKVLVLAGAAQNGGGLLSTAEIYDPQTNLWEPAAPLTAPWVHRATTLQNGKVLALGGTAADESESGEGTAELYDPENDTWSPAGSPTYSGESTALVTLLSGKVLRIVFTFADATSLAEIYDPAKNTWSPAKPLLNERRYGAAVLLPNGKVLVAGGAVAPGAVLIPFAEVYDPGGALGASCSIADDCESGFCADGVCCSSACDAGPCDACSVKAGALADGTCQPLDGRSCDDLNPCTRDEACHAGACEGTEVTCAPIDACHEGGSCDPATGLCSSPARPDGATCPGGACEEGRCAQDPIISKPSTPDPTEREGSAGCRCGVAGSRHSAAAPLLAALLLFVLRRRRSTRGRGHGDGHAHGHGRGRGRVTAS